MMVSLEDNKALKADEKPENTAVNAKKFEDLSTQEKRQLRMQRFTGGAGSTLEALEQLEEHKKRKQERAERFGIVTKEMNDKKIKNRQERFGIQTKESQEAKRVERQKRFAEMMGATNSGLSSEEAEKKRQERLKRFGEVDIKEALEASQQNNKSSGNAQNILAKRRKSKLANKLKKKQIQSAN